MIDQRLDPGDSDIDTTSSDIGYGVDQGVTFSYNHPTDGLLTLDLRLNPYTVEWDYNLITNIVDTFGGQVVQVLGVNISGLTITGQFGKEGPSGATIETIDGVKKRIKIEDKTRWNWRANPGPYAIGLTQMTEYFREYFAISTQGHDKNKKGHYIQKWMDLKYPGGRQRIIPNSMPSFRRANDNFAPEWRVDAYPVEVANTKQFATIRSKAIEKALNRINVIIGYPDKTKNPFSDPLVANEDEAQQLALKLVGMWKGMMPQFTTGQITDILYKNISVPRTEDILALISPEDDSDQDLLEGESNSKNRPKSKDIERRNTNG